MVPDRDRVDRSESRGVEHEKGTILRSEQNVMRILVLNDDIDRFESWMLPHRPFKSVIEGR